MTPRALLAIPVCLLALSLLAGCSSTPLPSARESEEKIERLRPLIAAADGAINAFGAKLVLDRDIALRIRREAFNRILTPLAQNRSDDARILFNGNRPWITEEKSLLGITYRNVLNIDGGKVDLNLTAFRIVSLEGNRVTARIAMEGKGAVSVSGSYAGIPASASPEIELDLADDVTFQVLPSDTGTIILQPMEKSIPLHTRFSVKLLEWRIPWNEVIMLKTTDLIKPIVLPSSISSAIDLPAIAQDPKEKSAMLPAKILIRDVGVMTDRQVLDWRGNVEFIK